MCLNINFCYLIISSALLILPSESSFINVYPKIPKVQSNYIMDPGEPLFLTPLIEAGNISEAQDLSRVYLTGHIVENIQSFSGNLTINKQFNSNIFFWFFPALVRPETAPVILWLQGGPGASSLFGLFVENGPISVTKNFDLDFREYTWNLNHSVIYIDNPVGTGYSFTDSDDGYARDETMVGEDLYQALLQFFQLFPELQTNPFFVTGESYGGKYVPAVSYTIHKHNPTASQKINLQGLAMGNGYSDPINQLAYGDYLYQLGLLDFNQRELFHQSENNIRTLIQNQDWEAVYYKSDEFIGGDLSNGSCLFSNITRFNFYFNFLHTSDYTNSYWGEYIQLEPARKMIHVGNKTFHDTDGTNKVEDYLKLDMGQSVVPWIIELLDHYRTLFYNGQLDIICAYPLTENYLRLMNFSSANEYANANREALYDDGKIIGYVKKAGNLTEVLVRDAGHMVPLDQPKSAFSLISRFVSNSL